MPQWVMPLLTAKIRKESSRVILVGGDKELEPYLTARQASGMRLNLNKLGEAILGELQKLHA